MSRVYEPVVELPVDATKPFALAGIAITVCWPGPTATAGLCACNVGAGCDRAAEKGEVPGAFDPAIASVAAITPGAPVPARLPTAAWICVKKPDCRMLSGCGTGKLPLSWPPKT